MKEQRIFMKKIGIVCGIVCCLLAGCQKEEMNLPQDQEELYPVQLNLSFKNSINAGTEYVPMTRAYTDKVILHNYYKYIIAEEIGASLIVVKTGGQLFNKDLSEYDRVNIQSNTTYKNIITELRPGKYHIFVFTNSMVAGATWTSQYQVGDIIYPANEKNKQKEIITYRDHDVTGIGRALAEEVFYANSSFEVTKNTVLDQNTNNSVSLQLERRVTKFRIIFEDAPSSDPKNILNAYPSIVIQDIQFKYALERVDGKPFCTGLDVWGNLYYGDDTFLQQYMYLSSMKNTVTLGSSSKEYHIPTYNAIYYAPYILTDPNEDIEVKLASISNGSATAYKIAVFVKYGMPTIYLEEDKWNDYMTFSLKNNNITGLVLKMNNVNKNVTDNHSSSGGYKYIMEPVYGSGINLLDPVDLLQDGNFEYRTFN